MTYDRWKSTDAAADDADYIPDVSTECREAKHDGWNGEESGCTGVLDESGELCACECHNPPPDADALSSAEMVNQLEKKARREGGLPVKVSDYGEPIDYATVAACSKCNAPPPATDAYRCRRCGAQPEENPYPTIGCLCILAGYLCDRCLLRESPMKKATLP